MQGGAVEERSTWLGQRVRVRQDHGLPALGSILGLSFGLYSKDNFCDLTRAFWLLCGLEGLEQKQRE